MKKYKFIIMVVLIMTLVGCGGGNTGTDTTAISEKDKTEYLDKAKGAITMIIDGDFDSLSEISSEDLNKALTEEVKAEISKDLSAKGEFTEFGSADAVIQKEKNSGKTYYITQTEVKFKDGKYIFTVNFDEEKNVAGVFYK